MKWLAFLGKHYREQKKTSPDYKYKQAMKDAVKPYRKHLSGGVDPVSEVTDQVQLSGAGTDKPSDSTSPVTPLVSGAGAGAGAGAALDPNTKGGRRRSRKGRRSAKRSRTSKRR